MNIAKVAIPQWEDAPPRAAPGRPSGPMPQPGSGPREPDRALLIWRAKRLIIGVALVAGALTYFACSLISPTYRSSATIRVMVQPVGSAISDSVTASNDIAKQYLQIVDSTPVIQQAAGQLHMSPGVLSSAVSAGTVSDQNLVSVSSDGPTPSDAANRANSVASSFVSYINAVNARQVAALTGTFDAQLAENRREISQAIASNSGALQGLVAQRQTIEGTLAQQAAAAQPLVEVQAQAGPGSKDQPKPVLYTLIAVLVAAFATAQIAVMVGRRTAS
jgi:capsular polysaccharide biosynthesis protein